MTDSCLKLLEDDFRPWPKHPSDAGGDNFYAIHDRNKVAHNRILTPALLVSLTQTQTLTLTRNLPLFQNLLHYVGSGLGTASRLSNAGRHCRPPTYFTRGLQAVWGRNSGVID